MELVSKFYLPDDTYCGLECRSKHRCPGHGLVPACRVSWGGASTDLRFLGCPLDVRDCEFEHVLVLLYEKNLIFGKCDVQSVTTGVSVGGLG